MTLAEAADFFEATLAASTAASASDRYIRSYHARFWFEHSNGTTIARELNNQSYSAILHSHRVTQQRYPALRAKFRRLGSNWARNPHFGALPALPAPAPPPAARTPAEEAPANLAEVDAEIASLIERLAQALSLRNNVERSSN